MSIPFFYYFISVLYFSNLSCILVFPLFSTLTILSKIDLSFFLREKGPQGSGKTVQQPRGDRAADARAEGEGKYNLQYWFPGDGNHRAAPGYDIITIPRFD